MDSRIKPLEWIGEEGEPGRDIYAKPSPEIVYTVRHLDIDSFDVILNTDFGSKWFRQCGSRQKSYEEAKDFASRDFIHRISGCLLPSDE